MNENELIEKVALLWVENGGDEDSFNESILAIHNTIMLLVAQAKNNRDEDT